MILSPTPSLINSNSPRGRIFRAFARFLPSHSRPQCFRLRLQYDSTLEEQAKAKWADVQNQYQRRADLIPNLVATVQGYAKQEKDVLTPSSKRAPRRHP